MKKQEKLINAESLAKMFQIEELEERLEMKAPWSKPKCPDGSCPKEIVNFGGSGAGNIPCMVDGCGITDEHVIANHFVGDGFDNMSIREIIASRGLNVNEGTVRYLEIIFGENHSQIR